jgi:hypothetical protein
VLGRRTRAVSLRGVSRELREATSGLARARSLNGFPAIAIANHGRKLRKSAAHFSLTGDLRNAIEKVVFVSVDRLRDAASGTENRRQFFLDH